MFATPATLNRRAADLNRQYRTIWQRRAERAVARRRTAIDLADELGIRLDPWQRNVLATDKRDVMLLVTRQGGKGETATLLALDALINDRGSTTVVVSKAERQARRLLRRIKRRYRQLANVPAPIADSQYAFELASGSEVLALPGSEETVRGIESVDLLIVDEAALVPEDLFNAVYPMLATTDGRCVAMTTARPGWSWFRRDWESEGGEWHRERIDWTQIPRFSPAFIERTRRRLGEAMFDQEFGCVFLPEGTGVFRRVREAAVAEPQDEPTEGHAYLVSVDWGKHRDFTVLAVWDATLRELVAIDRFGQVDYRLQLGRLHALCERFRPFALAPERNSVGDVLIEDIAAAPWCPPLVLPFTTTNASKALAVEAFALALEHGAVRVLDDPVLVGELQAFAAERLPSGMLRYSAPEGGHDDCVMAAIIGFHALSGGLDGPAVVTHDEPVAISAY